MWMHIYAHSLSFPSSLSHTQTHMHTETHQHIPVHKGTFRHTLTALSSHTLTHWFALKDMHVHATHTHRQPCTITHKTKTHVQISLHCALRGAIWLGFLASQSHAPTKIHCLSKHSIHQLPLRYILQSKCIFGGGFYCEWPSGGGGG